jgi:hypothetical protein
MRSVYEITSVYGIYSPDSQTMFSKYLNKVEDIHVVQVVGKLPVDLLVGKTSQLLVLCSHVTNIPLTHTEK